MSMWLLIIFDYNMHEKFFSLESLKKNLWIKLNLNTQSLHNLTPLSKHLSFYVNDTE